MLKIGKNKFELEFEVLLQICFKHNSIHREVLKFYNVEFRKVLFLEYSYFWLI